MLLDGSSVKDNQIMLVLHGAPEPLVSVVHQIRRAVDLLLEATYGTRAASGSPAAMASHSRHCTVVYDQFISKKYVASSILLSLTESTEVTALAHVLDPSERRLFSLLQLSSSSSQLGAVAALQHLWDEKHRDQQRPPLTYLEERRFLDRSMRLFPHVMCEFPDCWHPVTHPDSLPLPPVEISAASQGMAWLVPFVWSTFGRNTLQTLFGSSTSSQSIESATSSSQARPSNTAAPSDAMDTSDEDDLEEEKESDLQRKRPLDTGSAPSPAYPTKRQKLENGESVVVTDNRVSLPIEAYIRWLRSHYRAGAPESPLRYCQLPFPFATSAWLCEEHIRSLALMEGQFPSESEIDPLRSPPEWDSLTWEPWNGSTHGLYTLSGLLEAAVFLHD